MMASSVHASTATLRRALRAALMVLGLAGGATGAVASPVQPVMRSENDRYLVDQEGAPFLVVGDAPQSLMVNLTEADAESYFADRSAHGFNTVWINLLCVAYTAGRANGSTLDGTVPFTAKVPSTTSYDLTQPNEAYFAHVDRILALAEQHGLMVLLDPIETGGLLGTMLDNGTTRCRTYGQYLGSRYQDFDNIVWFSGNDFQSWRTPANDAVVRAVALGILDRDERHLHSIELNYEESSSLDDTAWASILGINGTYTYAPTYARLRADYGRVVHLPNLMIESNYEFESLQGPVTTAPILRKEAYWTMTSGATGLIYGNGYLWQLLSGWQDHLDTPGAIQLNFMRSFFEPRAWYALVPDTTHAVVTSGYGTYSATGYVADNNFLTAARTPDGSLVVVYTPVLRTFTVNLSKLSAPASVRWFDPSSGTYSGVTGSPFANSGTRDFTPPGNNRDGDGGWVLVLETNPPPPVSPVAHLAAAYAFDESEGAIATDASSNDNLGTVYGGTFVSGNNGNALDFDGESDYVEVPDSPSLDIGGTSLTISFWARIVDTPGGPDQTLLGKPWSANSMTSPFYQYGIEYSNSANRTLGFSFGDENGDPNGPYRMTPALGRWTHVAFTYDGVTVKGYLDGIEALSVATAATLVPRGNNLLLGCDGAHAQFFNGALDDVRIHGRALTPDEITGAMQTAVPGNSTTTTVRGSATSITLISGAPNPFRESTRIGFVLPAGGPVELRVFDASGRLVRTLAKSDYPAGPHAIEWDGADRLGRAVQAGRYFVRLRVGDVVRSVPVVRLR